MSISEREKQALGSIEKDLAGSVPELAAKLAVFTRLTAGEAMPPRERVWHPARTPPAPPATVGANQEANQEPARIWRWLRRRTVWRLVALALTIGLLALVFAASHGASKGICAVTGAAACRQAPALPPGRPGAGAAGVKDG